MTRKFLFCFPLRLGSIVFGYTVIIISVIVILICLQYLLQEMLLVSKTESGISARLENVFGTEKDLIGELIIIYYLTYIVMGLLLLVFGLMFLCGVYKMKQCSVSMFYVYSFIHLFFSLGLIVWEGFLAGWIQMALIIASDLLLVICLFSVKYLIEAMINGNIYTQPGEVLFKY